MASRSRQHLSGNLGVAGSGALAGGARGRGARDPSLECGRVAGTPSNARSRSRRARSTRPLPSVPLHCALDGAGLGRFHLDRRRECRGSAVQRFFIKAIRCRRREVLLRTISRHLRRFDEGPGGFGRDSRSPGACRVTPPSTAQGPTKRSTQCPGWVGDRRSSHRAGCTGPVGSSAVMPDIFHQ